MLDFTEKQKKIVAAGLTVVALMIVVTFVAFVLWAAYRLMIFAAPAIVPVIVGYFLSMFFKPYYLWWKSVARNPTLALLLMLVTVFLPLMLLVWCGGSALFENFQEFCRKAPALLAQVSDWLQQADSPLLKKLLEQVDLQKLLGDVSNPVGRVGYGAMMCFNSLTSTGVTLIFFIFFLMTRDRRGGEILAEVPFLKEETKRFFALQIDTFFDILVSFFQRQTVICLLEGCLYGTGFWMIGLPYGFMIGLALGVMNLIPFFGTITCLPVAALLAYFFDGSATRLVLVLVIWAIGQVLDCYYITPKIQGGKSGLGYASVIFSFVFWGTLLGPLIGMLLAIPLSAFCIVFWRAVKAKYLSR